jgi:hypothetical protein
LQATKYPKTKIKIYNESESNILALANLSNLRKFVMQNTMMNRLINRHKNGFSKK